MTFNRFGHTIQVLTLRKRRNEMATAIYEALTETEKREVRCYGCTEAQMREAVEKSMTFRFSGAGMLSTSPYSVEIIS